MLHSPTNSPNIIILLLLADTFDEQPIPVEGWPLLGDHQVKQFTCLLIRWANSSRKSPHPVTTPYKNTTEAFVLKILPTFESFLTSCLKYQSNVSMLLGWSTQFPFIEIRLPVLIHRWRFTIKDQVWYFVCVPQMTWKMLVPWMLHVCQKCLNTLGMWPVVTWALFGFQSNTVHAGLKKQQKTLVSFGIPG